MFGSNISRSNIYRVGACIVIGIFVIGLVGCHGGGVNKEGAAGSDYKRTSANSVMESLNEAAERFCNSIVQAVASTNSSGQLAPGAVVIVGFGKAENYSSLSDDAFGKLMQKLRENLKAAGSSQAIVFSSAGRNSMLMENTLHVSVVDIEGSGGVLLRLVLIGPDRRGGRSRLWEDAAAVSM